MTDDTTSAADHDEIYVVMKRGLFYRPNAHGYTACKCQAGRFFKAEAKRQESHEDGVSIMLLRDAPEYAGSEISSGGLAARLATLQADNAALREALRPFAMLAEMHLSDRTKDTDGIIFPGSKAVVCAGDLRRAARALKETGRE